MFARAKSITGQLARMFFEALARRILVIHCVPYLSRDTLRSFDPDFNALYQAAIRALSGSKSRER